MPEQREHNRPARRMKSLFLVSAAAVALLLGGGAVAVQAFPADRTAEQHPGKGGEESGVPCCKQLPKGGAMPLDVRGKVVTSEVKKGPLPDTPKG